MTASLAPRSTLHALEPLGLDTPDVESLTSYFCRLALSHSVTAQKLADWLLEHFDQTVCDKYGWHQRRLSGMSEESEQWAAWLAELTAAPSLDRLTLTPWRALVGTPGLAPKSDRWCPCCLAEDRAHGKEPYLRLAWDIGPVTACAKHKVELVSVCPHCQRSNARSRAATVVPGYCTSCGGFLGEAAGEPAAPEALWVARQAGLMLQRPPQVGPEGVVQLLETVVERMAGGNVAAFSRQLSLSKSGVWHWMKKGGQPSLNAWLAIALHGGIGLDRLFAGAVEDWIVPIEPVQLPIPLPASPRAGIKSRELDWEAIRAALTDFLVLPEPISINEACERLGVGRKHVYLQANAEARALADRHSRFRASGQRQREAELQARIEEILDERLEAGYEGLSARDVWQRQDIGAQSVAGVFGHIQVVQNRRR